MSASSRNAAAAPATVSGESKAKTATGANVPGRRPLSDDPRARRPAVIRGHTRKRRAGCADVGDGAASDETRARPSRGATGQGGESLFEADLLDLPQAMRWQEWMSRVEAAIFASPAPITREALAKLVGANSARESAKAMANFFETSRPTRRTSRFNQALAGLLWASSAIGPRFDAAAGSRRGCHLDL